MARLTADSDSCVGSANCLFVAPDLFGIDDEEGYVVLLKDEIDLDEREVAEAAVRSCPATALGIVDEA